MTKAHLAEANLALKPLVMASPFLVETRLALRKKTLDPFEPLNPHILSLIKYCSFSEDLFPSSTVGCILAQSQNLSKPLAMLVDKSL